MENTLDESIKQLAETKAALIAIQTDLEAIQANKDKTKAEIAALTAELAEAKKVELRLSKDGDYAIRKDGYYIHIKMGGDIFNNFKGRNPTGYNPSLDIKLGNIFDDLKDLQEDVTEIKVEGVGGSTGALEVRPSVDKSEVFFRILNHSCYIKKKDFPALILKIRQMEATMKRNQ